MARLAALALLALASAGCRHRGASWTGSTAGAEAQLQDPAKTVEVVEIVVIGQPREAAVTRRVALELERTLADARAAQRSTLIVWLGTDLGRRGQAQRGRCPDPGRAHAGPALSELTRVIAEAVEAGATAWGLPGPDGWRCGLAGSSAAALALPYTQPGPAYVLRVDHGGEVHLASSCAGEGCELEPPSKDTLIELVALDSSYWHFPGLVSEDLDAALLAQQTELLAALAAQPSVPRLLLSPIPVDSAGAQGVGGRRQRAGFRYLPEPLQAALLAGQFIGVLAALERDQQVSRDLANAIVRNARSFVAAPIFQVISGAAGGVSHTAPTSRGGALLPDLHSEHPGFARLIIDGDGIQLLVHARVASRWRVATLELPLRPAPYDQLREATTIQPCHSCDPLRGAGDREVFVPRGARPR